jgi:surfactin synthase thioesterase subunit
VCLGYSGGGTAPFRPWAAQLPDDTELVLVCYPGREARFTEPYATQWDPLCEEVVDAVVTELANRQYMLFGHSMGAVMAFEVAARAERRGRGPVALTVSASEAPTDWPLRDGTPPHLGQSNEELVHWMSTVGQLPQELLDEPEMVEVACSLLRADLIVNDTYRYREGTTVRAPMQVIYGVEDGKEPARNAERWTKLAAGRVRVDELPGGHFYTPEIWSTFPSRIASLGSFTS